MSVKLFFTDVETTGLDPVINDVVELAYIIDIDGKVSDSYSLNMAPHDPMACEQEALDIHGKTIADVMLYQTPHIAKAELINRLNRHCDKYDNSDKMYFVAYNANFDFSFEWEYFKKCGDDYFGSWFYTKYVLDPRQWFSLLQFLGMVDVPDLKLSTLAGHFNIPLDAHNALSDITATRELFYIALDLLKNAMIPVSDCLSRRGNYEL